jgi:hypothetical protein
MIRRGFGGLATIYNIMRQPGIQGAIDARLCRSRSVLQLDLEHAICFRTGQITDR